MKWLITGTRRGHAQTRIVEAATHAEAIARASKGRGFIVPHSCVLLTDAERDRNACTRAFAVLQLMRG